MEKLKENEEKYNSRKLHFLTIQNEISVKKESDRERRARE